MTAMISTTRFGAAAVLFALVVGIKKLVLKPWVGLGAILALTKSGRLALASIVSRGFGLKSKN
jgi:hypothetical protein